MIISASYKTDIPTFYGEWFGNRLDAGYCKMVNPYNRKAYRVSLEPDDVDGFVFWTKNAGPFLGKLAVISERGYPFIVQYTINEYPRALEFSVVDSPRSVEHMRVIAETYGPAVGVWRYDPILVSSDTPIDFHRRNFSNLARSLEGYTDEVVVSFAQVYRKTLRNLNWAADEFGFSWEDPPDETKFKLASELAAIALAHGIRLRMCSQDKYLAEGVTPARCIDSERLSRVAGRSIDGTIRGNRPDCACHASKDIGEYDTCPHGCVYCYAVLNRNLAKERYRQHDPAGEFLFPPKNLAGEDQCEPQPQQIKLL